MCLDQEAAEAVDEGHTDFDRPSKDPFGPKPPEPPGSTGGKMKQPPPTGQ